MEISQEYINKCGADIKFKLANDLCRLLQVREKNEKMITDWILFISDPFFKITPGEIYLAFQMAVRKEILDLNDNTFNIFPELSHNTTGNVIASYLAFKSSNKTYQEAKNNLKLISQPKKEITDSEKDKIRNEFLKTIYDDLVTYGFSSDAWQLFFDLEQSGKIKMTDEEKQKLYQQEYQKYVPAKKEEIRLNGGYSTKTMLSDFQKLIDDKKPLVYVKNRCRSITASEYLKTHLENFETFKNSIL